MTRQVMTDQQKQMDYKNIQYEVRLLLQKKRYIVEDITKHYDILIDAYKKVAYEKKESLKMPIESCEFSKRTITALMCSEIYNLYDLTELSLIELNRIPNIGKLSVNEILTKLDKLGLKLTYK
jgi:DNA-directed RNA polymerase alpha subunit